MMETYLIIAIVASVAVLFIGYYLGSKGKNANSPDNSQLLDNMREQIASLEARLKEKDSTVARMTDEIRGLTSQRDVQKAKADNAVQTIAIQKEDFENRLRRQKEQHDVLLADHKTSYEKQIAELRISYDRQVAELRDNFNTQLAQTKESAEKQIEALKTMNREQVDSQLKLIKEQMQTTSEEVLKRRQDELGERNKEQVSKIIDPLQQSLKDMQEAFNKSKLQQNEALTRLDETIKINMQKSAALGETADRLTRALTGEVKVQGNFGELKLKQLLEDLELKEGEQFDTQETLRDKAGRSARGDDGKGLVPDFILHFPNNRHVVVDSKMSLTDYERYMNAADGTPEKSEYLKAHIASVRAQVRRLARKEYTKFLPDGYNKLNFAIMYVPIEGALNLALLNDDTLWREAYDEGVMILGPQTMYMNLRVLEMMWTQVRQLKNQQVMIDAANQVIDRVQDFGVRFMDVETSMNDTIKKMTKLKITTADSGPSIITAARKLLKAGAKENQRKKTLAEMDESIYIESDDAPLLAHHQAGDADVAAADNETDNNPHTPTGNEEADS
ncbi:MAG: DNA recombination protein RmuC [Prevotella pectinovora]|uniref:DNA recombination protein RmuC n=1 Tax=Prevotella pectinovora TaxID=1602169 RepID=UPI002E79A5EF|nr:DNA recombination protein RmuC [Prevotella pectinovora]MEE1545729.1 DNA recombination protein RmuC [Prevotella pectinovora]